MQTKHQGKPLLPTPGFHSDCSPMAILFKNYGGTTVHLHQGQVVGV